MLSSAFLTKWDKMASTNILDLSFDVENYVQQCLGCLDEIERLGVIPGIAGVASMQFINTLMVQLVEIGSPDALNRVKEITFNPEALQPWEERCNALTKSIASINEILCRGVEHILGCDEAVWTAVGGLSWPTDSWVAEDPGSPQHDRIPVTHLRSVYEIIVKPELNFPSRLLSNMLYLRVSARSSVSRFFHLLLSISFYQYVFRSPLSKSVSQRKTLPARSPSSSLSNSPCNNSVSPESSSPTRQRYHPYLECLRDDSTLCLILVENLRDSRLFLSSCTIVESIFRAIAEEDSGASSYLEKKLFFEYDIPMLLLEILAVPQMEVRNAALGALRKCLLHQRSVGPEYISARYLEFFNLNDQKIMKTEDITIKRPVMKLLFDVLCERSYVRIMLKYVNDSKRLESLIETFLYISGIITLYYAVRDPSNSVSFEAFHLLKLFIRNPNKSANILHELSARRNDVLLRLGFLSRAAGMDDAFHLDKKVVCPAVVSPGSILSNEQNLSFKMSNTTIRDDIRPYHHVPIIDGYISIERAITDLLIQCCSEHPADIHVVLTFGKIVGTDNREPIILPILSDCLLEQNNDYSFIETVPNSTAEIIFTDVLPAAFGLWKIEGNGEISILEHHLSDNTTVGVQVLEERNNDEEPERKAKKLKIDSHLENHDMEINSTNDGSNNINRNVQYVRVTQLGELHICRPQSDLHFRISFITKRPVPPPDGIDKSSSSTVESLEPQQSSENSVGIERTVRRRLTTLRFLPNGIGADWFLTLGESYDLNPPSSICEATTSWLKSAEDGVEPIATLRLSPNPNLVVQHYQLFAENQKNGLFRIIKELLQHGRVLANLIGGTIESRSYYYPAYFGDIAAQARQHYNIKQAKGISAAHGSRIEALRKLNNNVKRCLIEEFVQPKSAVLDLACGHGQDILKYSEKKLTRFVGIDISSEEIREAGRRLRADRFAISCSWKFYVGNLLQDRAYVPIKDIMFDVVSCQLAIHYCMATAKQAEDFFRNISYRLNSGGVFIGSTGDCETIAERLHSGVNVNTPPPGTSSDTPAAFWFGNSVYSVSFSTQQLERACGIPLIPSAEEVDPTRGSQILSGVSLETLSQRFNSEWGIKYTFWLTEHINADEFVVPWKAFVEVARKFGLQLILSERFDCFFAAQLQKNRRIQQWKEDHLKRLPFDQRQAEAFSFYKVFVFRKLHEHEISVESDSVCTSLQHGSMPKTNSTPNQSTVAPSSTFSPSLAASCFPAPETISQPMRPPFTTPLLPQPLTSAPAVPASSKILTTSQINSSTLDMSAVQAVPSIQYDSVSFPTVQLGSDISTSSPLVSLQPNADSDSESDDSSSSVDSSDSSASSSSTSSSASSSHQPPSQPISPI